MENFEKLDFLKKWLNNNHIQFVEDFDLKLRSWIKAGGIIKLYIKPKTQLETINLVKFLNEQKVNFYVLGNISNTLIRDGEIFTPIINLNSLNKINQEKSDNILSVDAGVSLTRFSNYLLNCNISGAEGLMGIPGTMGGGVVMNASSYSSCISDYIVSVEVVDIYGNKKILTKDEINFQWRYSIFKDNFFIILKANFLFPKNNYSKREILEKKMFKIKKHRNAFQEKKYPNLGSTFATQNIYKDLSKKNIFFYIIYFLYRLLSFFCSLISETYLLKFRKFAVLFYSKLLGIKKSEKFFFSDRTINCVINLGSNNGNEAIKFVKFFENKLRGCCRLENIIIDKIE